MLEIHDVYAGYGNGLQVLNGVSLEVGQGEMVCLIGPNGAGKSTVLRVISGILRPEKGTVHFQEREIAGLRPDQILQRGIAHVPQGHSVFSKMTVEENLLLGAYTLRDRRRIRRRMDSVYEMFPILRERRAIKAGNLSGGQQKMLEMGRALMLEPPLMLLDEPSLGLAPKIASTLFEKIRQLNQSGVTILMVEQNARRGLGASHRGYVLELGKERFEGPAHELLDSDEIGRLYLGAA